MNTLLGTTYIRPTPEEVQALMRRAHVERAQVLRQILATVFRGRRAAQSGLGDQHASLRRAA